MRKGTFIWVLCFTCFLSNAAEYTFQSLSFPKENESLALGINNRGDALVWSGPSFFQDRFILRRNGSITHLFVSDPPTISPYAINNQETVTGEVWDAIDNRIIGFIQTKRGEFTSFSSPSAIDAVHPRAINDRGDIVGIDDASGFIRDRDGSYEYVYLNAKPTLLFGINNKRQISGQTADGLTSFIRDSDGTFTTFKIQGAQQTLALGINDRGAVVGFYFNGRYHGFVRSPTGAFTTVDVPGAEITQVLAINNAGELAVTTIASSGFFSGFIARPTHK